MKPENTFAFLISVQEYSKDEKLHELTQAFNNVSSLHKILKAKNIKIPKTNLKPVYDPEDKTSLLLAISEMAENPDAKTLIIYYAGHGILDDDGKHYLTLKTSMVEKIKLTGLNISDIEVACSGNKNLNIIIILDSCFSEKAFENFNARNYLLIASSAKNRTSKYPVDADYSVFTNELINILKNGIDIESDNLTWEDVYTQLEINLKEKGFPAPKVSEQNKVQKIVCSKNSFRDDEVSMDDQWVSIIKEIGKNNEKFNNKVEDIIDSRSPQMLGMLKEHLLNSFPYPIAYYLNKVFDKNPGKEVFIDLYESIIRFLFMISFIEYETAKLKDNFKVNKKFLEMMTNSYDDPDHEFCLRMLEIIQHDFKTNKIEHFLKEFDFFNPEFKSTLDSLEKLKNSSDDKTGPVKSSIFNFLTSVNFFIDYKLLSVKDVSVKFRKYDPMIFNHSVSILQGSGHTTYEVWSDVKENWQKAFVKHAEAKNNESVIFINCSNNSDIEYLNLWPMIIDKNVLEPKVNTPEIYLFAGKDEDDNYLYQNIREIESVDPLTYKVLEAKSTSYENIEKFDEFFVP